MDSTITVTPAELPDLLLHVATVRPVFIWGAPGIGKSALVRRFAADLGLPCETLLGTQLAPEDLIGVPQLVEGDDGMTRSRFAPPTAIAQTEPFCLFLDELNASSPDVQKAMYSLVLDRRLGELQLPEDSVVIGAGNRATDSALARPMASALVNRMVHVHLRADPADWLAWAAREGLHPLIIQYLTERPGHLWSPAPKAQEPFSTPRSWHILSDCLASYPDDNWSDHTLEVLTGGLLTAQHGSAFRAWIKVIRNRHSLEPIIKGEVGWPVGLEDRDVLYFLADNFRERLIRQLPATKAGGSAAAKQFAHRSKAMLTSLAEISLEMAQLVVANDSDGKPVLPAWYLVEVVRDLPRLAQARS
ncbi:MAG: MoxR family ATPase [Bifidobacteriaceae bacterium]|nr:MoxR family ATPase [Bifidobacteriaceae bacterium]